MRQDAILTVRVARIDEETPVVKRFTLVPVGTDRLPPFSAGAHITTFVDFDGRVFERNYSLIGDPAMRNVYQIAIRRSDSSQGALPAGTTVSAWVTLCASARRKTIFR